MDDGEWRVTIYMVAQSMPRLGLFLLTSTSPVAMATQKSWSFFSPTAVSNNAEVHKLHKASIWTTVRSIGV